MPPCAKLMAVDLHLVGGEDDEEIRLAARDHRAEDLGPKRTSLRDRAAALAHAVKLALLHVEPGAEGRVGQDVGGLEDALAAEAGDDDVGDGFLMAGHRRRSAHGAAAPVPRACS